MRLLTPSSERGTRLPVRTCGLCRREHDVLHVMRVGTVWVCQGCFRGTGPAEADPATDHGGGGPDAAPPAGVPSSGAPLSATHSSRTPPLRDTDHPRDSEALRTLRRVDRVYRGIGFALRILLYGGGFALSRQSPAAAAAFTGFLLADALTWLAGTVVDIRFHRVALSLELLLYATATVAWLSLDRTATLPEEPSLRAIAVLAFCLLLVVKIGWKVQRYVVSEP